MEFVQNTISFLSSMKHHRAWNIVEHVVAVNVHDQQRWIHSWVTAKYQEISPTLYFDCEAMGSQFWITGGKTQIYVFPPSIGSTQVCEDNDWASAADVCLACHQWTLWLMVGYNLILSLNDEWSLISRLILICDGPGPFQGHGALRAPFEASNRKIAKKLQN